MLPTTFAKQPSSINPHPIASHSPSAPSIYFQVASTAAKSSFPSALSDFDIFDRVAKGQSSQLGDFCAAPVVIEGCSFQTKHYPTQQKTCWEKTV